MLTSSFNPNIIHPLFLTQRDLLKLLSSESGLYLFEVLIIKGDLGGS